MIVSRAAELSRLDDLLTALADGGGGALVVRGEAGMGKTTLLDALAGRSGDAFTVIRACGAETEAELTFAALADLLDPVLDDLAALPEPQAAALRGALALGPRSPVTGSRSAWLRSACCGRRRRVLARLERLADRTGSLVTRAAAARCRGIVDDDFEPAFTPALALDDQRPMPFERARTLLAFGRRLHRARRRAEARDRLREARYGFEQLRAGAWAAQAEAELHAAGARRRREPDDRALTAQELRVAAAVQRGASNRDIAADLFLSPKTVEFHLRQIYRKLDVHSRTQLIVALAERAPPTGTP